MADPLAGVREVVLVPLAELRGPAAPKVQREESETAFVPASCPASSRSRGPADIVGSVLKRCAFVESLDERQPLTDFVVVGFGE